MKTFYVTRHAWAGGEMPDFGIVTLYADEPDEEIMWTSQENFERLTGMKLEPSETKQVQLIEMEPTP